MFVKTDTILDKILARKVEETAALDASLLLMAAQTAPPPRDFAGALRRETVALIAEVKHASPSKGILIEPFEPVELGKAYADNGAAAISVLTDQDFFKGHLDHLKAVRDAVSIPVLRKEFVIDVRQIYEGRAAGADAILLIAAALEDAQMADLHAVITGLGMAALVEVHDEAELARALRIGAVLIGVNNRDLKTFREDISITERMGAQVPAGVTLVAESAIRTPQDVRRMGQAGAHAVLVGEGLVKADNIAEQVRIFSSQTRSP
ncbi:MAG: indole-3-glycerol phosphate synthase TrpC [Anaerolineae bacterium]